MHNRILSFLSSQMWVLVLAFSSLHFYSIAQESTDNVLKSNDEDRTSLFNYIYELEANPKISITLDITRLINKSIKEEYQPAFISLSDNASNEKFSLPGRIRARGNMRKQVCRLPPVKFDFPTAALDSLGFLQVDKLKFVFPCRDKAFDQKKLYKEFFLYGLYRLINPYGIRAKLVNFTLIDGGQEKYRFTGMMIEDEDEYALSKNAEIIELGSAKSGSLDRDAFLKMLFFQYMIANTDWSIGNMHNVEMVKLPHKERVVPLPYDFDYSGFVGQSYAKPYSSLPITSIHQRYFFPYQLSENEFYEMVEYFLLIEDDVYAYCEKATYMDEKSIKQNKKYLAGFFDLLRNPQKMNASIVKK